MTSAIRITNTFWSVLVAERIYTGSGAIRHCSSASKNTGHTPLGAASAATCALFRCSSMSRTTVQAAPPSGEQSSHRAVCSLSTADNTKSPASPYTNSRVPLSLFRSRSLSVLES